MEYLQKDYGNVDKAFYMDHFYGIYGIGAIIIIIFSQYFRKNTFTLFIGGYIIGSVIEYTISFLTEIILHASWWDYSNNILNVNGRICLIYSIFWGILAVFLVKKFNVQIDNLITWVSNNFSKKILKNLLVIMILLLLVDCLLTCYAQQTFIDRMVVENNIDVVNLEEVEERYNNTYNNKILSKVIYTLWNDEKMIRTFPNIKIKDRYNNIIYIDSLLKDIKPYYIKIFDK